LLKMTMKKPFWQNATPARRRREAAKSKRLRKKNASKKKAPKKEGSKKTDGTDGKTGEASSSANPAVSSALLVANAFANDADSSSDEEGEEDESEEEAEEVATKPKKNNEDTLERKFQEQLRTRLHEKKDFGETHKDTIRCGEGPHWKKRYYAEKFDIEQDDFMDFVKRIRKAYVDGLAWVLRYYYQGVASWTWFYPYHYAPFGSDLIGMAEEVKESEFKLGKNFQPVQQLMAVLPPASARAAGIPGAMLQLMESKQSPIADFFPIDFGLDLNGKRFAWQGVVLLPFIDEPRLLKVLAPLVDKMTDEEKARNVEHMNHLYSHVSDLQKKLPPKGNTVRRRLKDHFLYGYVTGQFGASEDITSPIPGLDDVEESECVMTKYTFPERVVHSVDLLPEATFEPAIVSQADLDDLTRLKGFGGIEARKLIMQALGIFIPGAKKGKGKGKGKKGGGFKGGKPGKDAKGKGKPAFDAPAPTQLGPRRPPMQTT